MVSSPQGVWASTTGGALLWDANRQAFRQFTNADGLRQNITKAIGRDNRGRIWIFLATGTIAQPTGLIEIYDPDKNSFIRLDDYVNRNIYDFTAAGDSMYIALDRGISLYDIRRNEVKETYQNLGRNFPRGTAVNALFIDGLELWAGTSIGIARASLNQPNLLAPESWTNYTSVDGLPSSVVRGFAKFSQSFVAATSNGVAAFDGQRWTNISGNIGSRQILQLATAQENSKAVLYAATPDGVFRSETLGAWSLVGSSISVVTGIVIDESGTLWASTYDNGLYEFDRGSRNWRLHEPDGPATNTFSSVSLDLDANLWCTSSSNGLQIYDGTRWYNYNLSTRPVSIWPDVRQVAHLPNGDHWVATWGDGIYVLSGSVNALTIKRRLNATTGELATALGETNYPAVPFLKLDAQNNIWILNYNAANTNALLARTLDDNFVYFSTSDGLRSMTVSVLEIEKRENDPDRIWVGTNNSGVSVLDYQGTLLDKLSPRRDDWSGELDLDDNLLGLNVTSIAQDRDGYMWIGTDKGLNYWFGGAVNDRFCYSLISDDVKIVKVDPRNNKWIGTSAGISVLSGEDNCSLTHYTVENSLLVGNFVTSIAFNPKNGDAWIGTTTGLSRLRTPFTEPQPNLSQLKGYPNPLKLGSQAGNCGDCVFRFSNLTNDSAVKIYNVAGELVRSYAAEQIRQKPCWDGRDASCKLVPSGIYLYVAFDEALGASGVGKVAVVRQ
jgi:ligand-binding sensor domain-containing protein